jgi:1,4-alpha-glucan branching enzyme
MAIEIAPKVKKATVAFTTQAKKGATKAILKGEWDNWKACAMKKNMNGTFSATVNIDLGKSYQFGYSIDEIWTHDTDLPLVTSPFGTDNSILDLTGVTASKVSKPKTEKTAAVKRKPAAKTASGKKAAK